MVLYEKSGYLAKALDVAIATNQHNALLSISKEITADSGEENTVLSWAQWLAERLCPF